MVNNLKDYTVNQVFCFAVIVVVVLRLNSVMKLEQGDIRRHGWCSS